MHRLFFALALLFVLAPPTAAASGPPELQPLLRIRVEGFLFDFAVDVEEDWSLFRDGLLLYEFRIPEDGHNRLLRGRATAAEMARLQADLATARIGLQGDCLIEISPHSEVSDTSRIVWFGRGERRHAFTVEREFVGFGTGTPCPAPLLHLLDALESLRSVMQQRPETVEVFYEE